METFIGAIVLFPFHYDPAGWVECDGRMLSTTVNHSLYNVIGNAYGGDGNDTFAVPDLRAKVPIEGMRYCIAVQGTFPPRY